MLQSHVKKILTLCYTLRTQCTLDFGKWFICYTAPELSIHLYPTRTTSLKIIDNKESARVILMTIAKLRSSTFSTIVNATCSSQLHRNNG